MRDGLWRGPGRFRLHRPVDLVAAIAGLPVIAPVVIVAALAVRLTSSGPGFFRQVRIGRSGHPFEIVKLRTMATAPADGADQWSSVTAGEDHRVTPLGRRLRRWKLDELPQLVNVIRGEMSLVGPRPDVAGFADVLSGDAARVIAVRPGITGPATLLFRNEQSFLGALDDPAQFSDTTLYDAKVQVNLAWIETGTLLDDLKLILYTVGFGDEDAVRAMVTEWAPDLMAGGPVAEALEIAER